MSSQHAWFAYVVVVCTYNRVTETLETERGRVTSVVITGARVGWYAPLNTPCNGFRVLYQEPVSVWMQS
jgi:hypothetical protein